MKTSFAAAFLLALPLAAQDDVVLLLNGTKIDGVKITSFNVREVKYTKGGASQSVPTDQVRKIEPAKFKEVYRIGLKDSGLMLTKSREQLAEKDELLGQLGLLNAASQLFDEAKPVDAMGVLDELQKALPEAGVLPDVYRLKFEYYMGLGEKGAANAVSVAKKYSDSATGGAWPAGLATEAQFFAAMAERAAGGQPKDLQHKLRGVISKAMTDNPMVANRANVQLANSLREAKDNEGARKIYEEVVKKEGVDDASRAGCLLGLGLLTLDQASSDKDAARKALMMFLRVRLETREAWPSQHAESLYWAVKAADKWRGNDYQFVMGRCRGVLFNDYGDSEWASRMKSGG